jgi:hypothetical protein
MTLKNTSIFCIYYFETIYAHKNENDNIGVFFNNKKISKSLLGFEKWTKINVQK